MFPMEFDYRVLATLPLPGDERKKGIMQLLRALVTRRILPFFRNRRGTDSSRIDHVDEHLTLVRMEDKTNRIRIVSTMTRADDAWTIRIHERLLDFFSFVLSGDLESRLEN
ncbi:MAG TPA: hypothetical protein PKV86_12320, partial [Syntrophobacteraceae bacterium]|nr:hypothetical protein [Syntrophobacteraceae bacterium]